VALALPFADTGELARTWLAQAAEATRTRVVAGSLKLTVDATELRAATRVESLPNPTARAAKLGANRSGRFSEEMPIRTRDNTCDLRGLRVDDGVAVAMSFLDRAVNEGRNFVFLLHGHGADALRDALRKEVSRSTCVRRLRSGDRHHGGEAVTGVWLT
jgi:DNA mismatch repair protein MutS2